MNIKYSELFLEPGCQEYIYAYMIQFKSQDRSAIQSQKRADNCHSLRYIVFMQRLSLGLAPSRLLTELKDTYMILIESRLNLKTYSRVYNSNSSGQISPSSPNHLLITYDPGFAATAGLGLVTGYYQFQYPQSYHVSGNETIQFTPLSLHLYPLTHEFTVGDLDGQACRT